jgi:hypothetical protein
MLLDLVSVNRNLLPISHFFHLQVFLEFILKRQRFEKYLKLMEYGVKVNIFYSNKTYIIKRISMVFFSILLFSPKYFPLSNLYLIEIFKLTLFIKDGIL